MLLEELEKIKIKIDYQSNPISQNLVAPLVCATFTVGYSTHSLRRFFTGIHSTTTNYANFPQRIFTADEAVNLVALRRCAVFM